MYFVNLWTLKSHHSEALLIWNLVFPNKNVDPSIERDTHTRFCPLSTVAFVNNMYSVPAEPEWMTVSSVQPRSTNHAARLGGKQSLRPKMKEEKGAPLKNKIIYQIFLLVCFGFCNSGMLPSFIWVLQTYSPDEQILA